MKKLYDLIGTRYIYGSIIPLLLDLVEQGIKEMDVAGCKFTPECAKRLVLFQRAGIYLTDSEDSVRERIFRSNEVVFKEERTIDNKSVDLPLIIRNFNLVDYLANLEASDDIYYTYNYYQDEELNVALFIIISMLRPEVRLRAKRYIVHIHKSLGKFFTRTEVDKLIAAHEPLVYLYEQATIPITLTPQMRNITPIGEQEQSILEFRSKHILIPAYFGNEPVSGGVWDKVYLHNIQIIEDYHSKFSRTMARLITSNRR